MKSLAHGVHSSPVPSECTGEQRCLQQTESPVKHVQEDLWILHGQARTIPLPDSSTHTFRGKCGHQPLQKAQCERQAERELLLKQASLCHLLSGPSDWAWCAECQQDTSHSLNMSPFGIPGPLAKSVHSQFLLQLLIFLTLLSFTYSSLLPLSA